MQVPRPSGFQKPPEPFAEGGVGPGTLKQGLNKGPQVEPSSADKYRETATSHYFLYSGLGSPGVFTRGEIFGWVGYINQMMWYRALVLLWDFCGGYVQTAIHLDRIKVDDFAAQPERQLDAQIALTGGRGANYGGD
jgi:hypothetical protein